MAASARLYCGGQLLQATFSSPCRACLVSHPWQLVLWVMDGTGQITLLRLVSSLGPLMTRVWRKRHIQFWTAQSGAQSVTKHYQVPFGNDANFVNHPGACN